MASTKVYAPNKAFTGEVAGVLFKDGVGTLNDEEAPAARRYFERQGYGLGSRRDADDTPEPADPRDIERTGPHRVGTPLRDAAVDPQPEDFLPPINAGDANPHGPRVVAPEIHASGPKGIKPGDVHVDELEAQQAEETELAQSVLVEGGEHPSMPEDPDMGPLGLSDPGSVEQGVAAAENAGPPSRSSSKATWVDYAVSQGANRDEAEAMTRADLIEAHGG